MAKEIPDAELTRGQFYHGTRVELYPGDVIEPCPPLAMGEGNLLHGHVLLTSDLDEAIWDAEIAPSEGFARVYTVSPLGEVAHVSQLADHQPPGHPSMSYFSTAPLSVTGEVTQWTLYHGTRADLKPGDLIEPGHAANFGREFRKANHVYLARTLDAAIWGAELAKGEGPGRIYIVEPLGSIEDDPNLTDKKFRGNPTKSFRSREPLRITAELMDWQGHSLERIEAMKNGIEKLEQQGRAEIDD